MASPINPRDPIHVGIKKASDGKMKLTLSSGDVRKEVTCKVVTQGVFDKAESLFLQKTNWVVVQHKDFRDRNIQIFVKKSDLEGLKKEGFDLAAPLSRLPATLVNRIEEFFRLTSDRDNDEVSRGFDYVGLGKVDERAADFLSCVEKCLESGGEKLSIPSWLEQEGKCPDIFDDPLFKNLQVLDLPHVSDLPPSIRHLKNLKSLDLRASPMVIFPDTLETLTNLEYLNLAYSGINSEELLAEFGERYSHSDAVQAGASRAVDQLFKQLQFLKHLKAVNMKSILGDNCPSELKLKKKFLEARLPVRVISTEEASWNPYNLDSSVE